MTYLHRVRFILAPLCASIVLACGSSTDAFTDDSTDTGTTDDTASGGDGTGTDGSGTDGSGTDGVATDTTPPPTDTAGCAGTVCGGACVDTKTDPLNCGGCGKVVCHDEACQDGKPVCAAGLRPCGGAGACLGCKNLRSDPNNCGACGNVCSGVTATCVPSTGGAASTCQLAATGCATGLTRCPPTGTPSACVNTTTDITNCGGCGVNCSPGEFCADGTCTKYTSAPGCTSCPCAACTGATDKCCRYTDGTVCASKCPGG